MKLAIRFLFESNITSNGLISEFMSDHLTKLNSRLGLAEITTLSFN